MANDYDDMLGIHGGSFQDPSLTAQDHENWGEPTGRPGVAAGWASGPMPLGPNPMGATEVAPKENPAWYDTFFRRTLLGGAADAITHLADTGNDLDAAIRGTIDQGLKGLGVTNMKYLGLNAQGKPALMTADQYAQADQANEARYHADASALAPAPTNGIAKMGRSVVDFGVGLAAAGTVLKAAQGASWFTRSAVAVAKYASVGFAETDKSQGDLMNVAQSLGIDQSHIANELHIDSLVDALAINDDDSAITARLKNAADTAIGGAVMDAGLAFLGKGVAAFRGVSKAKLAAEAEAAAENAKIGGETIPADIAAHADDQVSAIKGEPTAAEAQYAKDLEAHQASLAEDTGAHGAKIEAPEAPVDPTASKQGGVENIVPQLTDGVSKLSEDGLKEVAQAFEDGKPLEALERTGVNPGRVDFGKFLASFSNPEEARAGVQDLMLRAAKAAEPISQYFGSAANATHDAAVYGQLTGQSVQDVVQSLQNKTVDLHTYVRTASAMVAGEAQKLYALALKAKPYANLPANSPEALALFKQWETLTTLQGAMRGSQSNIGRGLQAIQNTVSALEAKSGDQLANSILGKAHTDEVMDRLQQITDGLRGDMTPQARKAFIDAILNTKGDVVKIAKNAADAEGSGVQVAAWRALRETSANLFGLSTLTMVATSSALHYTTELVAKQFTRPLAMLTKDREWVAAAAAANAELGALAPSMISGAAHGLQLVAHDALQEVGNALDGTSLEGLRKGTDALGKKVDSALEQLPTGSDKLGTTAQGPLKDKYLREGVSRDAYWYLKPDTLKTMAEFPNHGPGFWQAAQRSLIGAAGAVSNSFGSLSRFGRTITVDLADNVAGNTVYGATRWSEAVRTATGMGIDRGLFGDELGKFASAEAKRLVSETSGQTRAALQNLVATGSYDEDTAKMLAQDYLDRRGIERIAETQARRMLFQDDLQWKSSQGVQKFFQGADPGGIIMPFVKTPLRILEVSLGDYTPLGLFQKDLRAKLFSGGPDSVVAATRMLAGTALLLKGYADAANGTIVGYDGGAQSSARLERPMYSMKVGDRWVGYDRLDPFALTLGAGADLYQFWKAEQERNENAVTPSPALLAAATAAWHTAVQGVLSKSWLTSLDNVAKMTNEREADQGFQQFIGGLVQRFVPMAGLQKAIAQEGTGHIKQTASLWDQYKQSWAVMGDTLPDKRDSVLGEPLHANREIGAKVTQASDPVTTELGRLAFQLSPDVKSISGVHLTADQIEKLKQLQGETLVGGQSIRDRLSGLFGSDTYRNSTQDQQVQSVENIRSEYREVAQQGLLLGDKELNANVEVAKAIKQWRNMGTAPEAIPAKVQAFKKALMSQ